jgi:starvation-inducible DNA-binding protein
MSHPFFTVPGMNTKDAGKVSDLLQRRLVSLIDLQLTLKHIHWNVVGPTFIGVHEMLDPQVDWDDYSLGRATVLEHLGALDQAYTGVVAEHRAAIDTVEDLDKVTQDMLIGQSEHLERYHWFVRAHLENAGGHLSTEGSTGEKAAARAAAKKTSSRRRAS